MLSVPLNKGDLYETHSTYRLDLIYSTCSSNRQSELKARGDPAIKVRGWFQ